jgi:hypothetical protein
MLHYARIYRRDAPHSANLQVGESAAYCGLEAWTWRLNMAMCMTLHKNAGTLADIARQVGDKADRGCSIEADNTKGPTLVC